MFVAVIEQVTLRAVSANLSGRNAHRWVNYGIVLEEGVGLGDRQTMTYFKGLSRRNVGYASVN